MCKTFYYESSEDETPNSLTVWREGDTLLLTPEENRLGYNFLDHKKDNEYGESATPIGQWRIKKRTS